jgi:hypothetical protein
MLYDIWETVDRRKRSFHLEAIRGMDKTPPSPDFRTDSMNLRLPQAPAMVHP